MIVLDTNMLWSAPAKRRDRIAARDGVRDDHDLCSKIGGVALPTRRGDGALVFGWF